MYKLVTKGTRTEIVINKSRFIGTSFSCTSEEDAKQNIAKIRKEFLDATHNCYAYVFDTLGNALKFSDDGEPQGTAGMPILEVIRNKGLVSTGVVVTRYFGGIKLGAGGLVRAYTEAAAKALENSCISEMTECVRFSIKVDYPLASVTEKALSGVIIENRDYTDSVTYFAVCKDGEYKNTCETLKDATLGKGEIVELSRGFYPF